MNEEMEPTGRTSIHAYIGLAAGPLLFTAMLLAVPTAPAASCAFMLPVATPPNALVYGTGQLTIPQMAKAGWWLNLFFVALLSVAVDLFAGFVFTSPRP